jgi:hypothetical protein
MNNEEIYIDEIITLWSNEDGICLSNDYNTVTIRPQTLFDWLPSIIEVTMKQKKKDDEDLIMQLKHKINGI